MLVAVLFCVIDLALNECMWGAIGFGLAGLGIVGDMVADHRNQQRWAAARDKLATAALLAMCYKKLWENAEVRDIIDAEIIEEEGDWSNV